MKAGTLLRFGLLLILIGIVIHFLAGQGSSVLLDPSLTTSTKPVYIVDEDRQKAFIFTSEILSVLGVILTSIAAFRLVKVP